MATYDELRDALRHISDAYADPSAWQRGMSAQDVADINGYLNAESNHRPGAAVGAGAGGHASGVPGWEDPVTHKVYEYRPTSTGAHPQVPDTLIGALRNHFPGLFGPNGGALTPPPGQTPPLTPTAPPPAQPPTETGQPTGEQQSGRTADAVRKLHDELQRRYNTINAAEEQLSEALLSAHATTADGMQKLNDIQKKIVEAVNNPSQALDTPAGQTQFLRFLRAQVGAIADVVNSGSLTDADQASTIKALADLYAADPGSSGAQTPTPADEPGVRLPESVGPQPGSIADLGSGAPLPDPSLSDLGLGSTGIPLGPMTDPLSSLAAVPASLGAFPQAPVGGLDPLSGLAGVGAPLAGLAAQLGDQPRHDSGTADNKASDGQRADEHPGDKAANDTVAPDPRPSPQRSDPPGPQPASGVARSGAPPAGPADSQTPTATTTIELPDGSTANAATPAAAQAVRAYLAGTPLDAAYRQAGVDLPPPGTPVTAPIDPSQLAAGDVGMFKDHYVVALGAAKAVKDGQVVPLASAASGPDFLGWMRPSAPAPPQPVAAAPAAATVPAG